MSNEEDRDEQPRRQRWVTKKTEMRNKEDRDEQPRRQKWATPNNGLCNGEQSIKIHIWVTLEDRAKK